MRSLTAFQDAFSQALNGRAGALAPWLAEPDPPGLSVYRNTTGKGAVDALAASYPTVERLVGEDWFAAAAGLYARENPPTRPSLLGYGGDFPEWLGRFEPARPLPYLPGVARIDALWTQAHFAADAEPAPADALAGLGAEQLQRTRAAAHPAARLAWFDDNTPSLWAANRPPAESLETFELTDVGEGILLTRPGLVVEARLLDVPAFAFLEACLKGRSLAQAAAAALAADRCADLAAIASLAVEAGAFTRLEPVP